MEGAHDGSSDGKHPRFHELCRGALEPFKSAIPSELLLLPGCHILQEDAGRVFNRSINKETVLEQIILDMTGTPAPSISNRDAENASLQRSLRRTKRLLTRTNSVLLFRLVTMVIVACMLLVSVFLTWNFTRNFSGHSIQNLSFTLRREILRSSLNSMVSVLTRSYMSSLTLAAMHQHMIFAVRNATVMAIRKELRNVNWGFFQAERHLNSVAFVSKDGYVTDYGRKGLKEYLYFTGNYSNASWFAQPVTGSLNGSGSTVPLKSPAPFQNGYIAELLAKKDLVWSLDTGFFQQHIFSSAAPVTDPVTQSFLGMSVVSSPLKEVYDYASEAGLLGGYLYFFRFNSSHDLTLIGSSCSNATNTHTDPSSYAPDVAFYLNSVYGNDILLLKETHSEDVHLKGRRFYIDSMPLKSNFESLNLTAVLIIPRSSIMGEIDARSKTIIKVSVTAALGILVIGSVLICFLTRRMSTEMQLRQELIRQLVAKHKAEQSSNYKSQFLANMSHEMRTPMAGIIGLLDLLACDTLTPDQRISVVQIRQCATGLLALVNNVLDISKIEAGKMELEITSFDLMKELESLVDMFAVQSSCSDVEVMLVFSDDFPCELKGDLTRIRQIFTNLLSNSVKFTETGHILVRGWTDQSLLSLPRKSVEHSTKEVGDVAGSRHSSSKSSRGSEAQRDSDKIALMFEVDDTGCGIPCTMQETVFDRFVQADSSTTRTHGGSGLGLYIVRSLVNMMGGEVQIVSKPGPGTRVQFHLLLDMSVTKGIHCHSEDALSAFVSSPMNQYPVEGAQFPTNELLMRTHALIAMPENVTKSIITYWLQKRGLNVSTVYTWDNILPTTNKLCKLEYSSRMPRTMKNASCLYPESPSSPFALPSGGSSSCVSDITSKYPVLALIDISLLSSSPMSLDTHLSELEGGKIPEKLNFLISSLQHLQSKSDLLIVWVTPPKTRPSLKQALLSLLTSVVIKKPLYPSKMKWLLSLLTDLGKSEPPTELFGYTSSNPSTPRLTGANSPLKSINLSSSIGGIDSDMCYDRNSGYQLASKCGDEKLSSTDAVVQHANLVENDDTDKFYIYDAPGCKYRIPETERDEIFPMVDTLLPDENFVEDKDGRFCSAEVFKENSVQGKPMPHISMKMYQEQKRFHVEDTLSTPESLTSGLATPEDMLDAGLETRSELDNGNEWQEPDVDSPGTSGIKCLNGGRKNPAYALQNAVVATGGSTSTVETQAGTTLVGKQQPAVFAGMHILLVEDTPVLQRLASMTLKKLGAEVTVVGDGLRAVEAVAQAVEDTASSAEALKNGGGMDTRETRSKQFDLILMDCAMPVMDGYCATRAIREAELNTGRHIPIVALTAHALASDEEKCLAVGMDAYLTKPINCKQLVSTVQSLVTDQGSRKG